MLWHSHTSSVSAPKNSPTSTWALIPQTGRIITTHPYEDRYSKTQQHTREITRKKGPWRANLLVGARASRFWSAWWQFGSQSSSSWAEAVGKRAFNWWDNEWCNICMIMYTSIQRYICNYCMYDIYVYMVYLKMGSMPLSHWSIHFWGIRLLKEQPCY